MQSTFSIAEPTLTNITERTPTIQARRRRPHPQRRNHIERGPDWLVKNRKDHRRQADRRQLWRPHTTNLQRPLSQPGHAQEQEARRTRRLHRWCQDTVSCKLDTCTEEPAQGDSVSDMIWTFSDEIPFFFSSFLFFLSSVLFFFWLQAKAFLGGRLAFC